MNFIVAIRFIFIISAIVFAIVAGSLTGVWATNKPFNDQLTEGTCNVTRHPNVAHKCTRTSCYNKGCPKPYGPCAGGQQVCQTYTTTCYHADIVVHVIDHENQFLSGYLIRLLYDTTESLAQLTQDRYPIGESIPCYYKLRNQYVTYVQLENPNGIFIAAMVFWGAFGMCLLLWGIGELINCIKK